MDSNRFLMSLVKQRSGRWQSSPNKADSVMSSENVVCEFLIISSVELRTQKGVRLLSTATRWDAKRLLVFKMLIFNYKTFSQFRARAKTDHRSSETKERESRTRNLKIRRLINCEWELWIVSVCEVSLSRLVLRMGTFI